MDELLEMEAVGVPVKVARSEVSEKHCCRFGRSCLTGDFVYTEGMELERGRSLVVRGEVGVAGADLHLNVTGMFPISETKTLRTSEYEKKCSKRNFLNDRKNSAVKLWTSVGIYQIPVNLKVKHGCKKQITLTKEVPKHPDFDILLNGKFLMSKKVANFDQASASCIEENGVLYQINSE